MTAIPVHKTDHVGNDAVLCASRYMADPREGQVSVLDVRKRYGLTTPEILEAIAIAHRIERSRQAVQVHG